MAVAWRPEPFEPPGEAIDAADVALDALRRAARRPTTGSRRGCVDFETAPDRLALELQPARWALRLIPAGAAQSLSALCVVRAADGRWLAGRRAAWLATWAGRWALGAGGSVEVDENPADTMAASCDEEWSVAPERLQIEALLRLPSEARAARRPGVAAPTARPSRPTTSTTSSRGGRPTVERGRPRPTSRCAGWPSWSD